MSDNRATWERGRPRLTRRRVLWGTLPVLATLVAACAGRRTTASGADGVAPGQGIVTSGSLLVAQPAADRWPEEFRRAAPEVQEAYRYAVAHRDVLKYIPCYCGCVNQGHTSNYDCYVRESRPDGSVVLDPMSFG